MCECNSTVVSGVDRRVGVSVVNCSLPVNHSEPSAAFRAAFSDERSESTPPSAAGGRSDTTCTTNNAKMPAISQNHFHEHSTRTFSNSAGHTSPATDYCSEQSNSDATGGASVAMPSALTSAAMPSTSVLNPATLLTRTNGTDRRYHGGELNAADGITDNFSSSTNTSLLSTLSAENNTSNTPASSAEPDNNDSSAVLENTAEATVLPCSAEEAQQEQNLYSSSNEPADDDGYMDELDGAIAAAAGDTRHQLCDDLDAGLDDFIDADMPHNVRSSSPVGESPSSSSLSSLRDEQIQEQELAIGEIVDSISDRAVSNEPATVKPSAAEVNMVAAHQNYQFDESFLAACPRPSKLSWPVPNGEANQCAAGAEACANINSRVPNMSSSSANQFSNPTSECSFDTPPASLPSPNYDLFAGVVDGIAASAAAPQLAMLSDDNAFDDDDFRLFAGNSLPNGTESLSDNASCVPPHHNECFWLPINDVHPIVNTPSFGCWSCFSALDGIDPCKTGWKSNWRVVYRPDTSCGHGQADVKTTDYSELFSKEAALNGMRKQNSVDSNVRTKMCSDVYPNRRQVQSSASVNQFSSQMTSSLTLDDRRFDDDYQPCEASALSSPGTRNSRFSSSLRLRVNSRSTDTNGRAHWSDRIESAVEPSAAPYCDISHYGLDASKSSSCSTVSVIHLLHMLGIEHNHRDVGEMMHANRTVPDKMHLCDFLKAHSQAGLSAEQLINGLSKVTAGRIYGKFFSFPRKIELAHWLASWIRLGAVPMATLKFSIKSSAENSIEVDAWMHMTIYNVLPLGIVMGDQLSFVTESELTAQLATNSTVRLHRNDIMSRWRDDCDLGVVAMHPDPCWRDLNVLGQVVNILRESRLPSSYGCRPYLTSYLTLPTHCRSGITLYAVVGSPAFVSLQRESPDLMPSSISNSLLSDSMTDGCVRTSGAVTDAVDDLVPLVSSHDRSSVV